MDLIVYIVKYGFIVALAVQAVLIGRALIGMALEKARAAAPPPAAEE